MTVGLAVLTQAAAAVALANSDFGIDAEGRRVKDLPCPSPGRPPVDPGTYAPAFNASGGSATRPTSRSKT